MRYLKKCYNFIREDVFLCAQLDTFTGKQKLIMEQIDKDTGRIIDYDSINCIHTAICEISPEEYNQEVINGDEDEFNKKILKIRSSEDLHEINLSNEEKFKAFKSWVAGIAEAGRDAFRIQAEIDAAANLLYPILSKLMRFMAKIDEQIAFEYLFMVERNALYEGVKNRAYLIINLTFFLDMIISELQQRRFDLEKLSSSYQRLLEIIFQIDPPIELFLQNAGFKFFLQHPKAAELSEFKKLFKKSDKLTKLFMTKNPNIFDFKEVLDFLDYRIEPDADIRVSLARHPKISQFLEFKNLFNRYTEPSFKVRAVVASRKDAVDFREYEYFFYNDLEDHPSVRANAASNPYATKWGIYKRFLTLDGEPSKKVHIAAAANPNAPKFDEYRIFLSQDTCPDPEIRMQAARNSSATRFAEYKNFLSTQTEPDMSVRGFAAKELNATKFEEFRNFLSYKTEPEPNVRYNAAQNPFAPKFKEFANFLSYKTEPNVLVRKKAAENINAPKIPQFRNFLSYRTEPEFSVRLNAASNPNAVYHREFGNFIITNNEPIYAVRDAAKRNKKLEVYFQRFRFVDDKIYEK